MKYVLSNWKMYTTVEAAVDLAGRVEEGLEERRRGGRRTPTVILCPPFVSLTAVGERLGGGLVRLGAQNCHWEREGPYTGEISPAMLEGLVDYVLIGHSERRAAGETDDQLARKVAAAGEAGLIPVLFAGEDEPTDAAARQAQERLERGLAHVDPAERHVLVVYEPTWAIGADEAAEADHVRAVVEHLKERLRELGSRDPEVVYGGTVNADNVEQLTAIDVLDGVGATRAGLEVEQFLRIVDRVAAAGADGDEASAGG